jgi:hypothetical protein
LLNNGIKLPKLNELRAKSMMQSPKNLNEKVHQQQQVKNLKKIVKKQKSFLSNSSHMQFSSEHQN